MPQFYYYLRLIGTETVFCLLLLRLARMNMHQTSRNLANVLQSVLRHCLQMSWLVLSDKILITLQVMLWMGRDTN